MIGLAMPEIEAVRAACAVHGEDVNGSILFATVEPCPMWEQIGLFTATSSWLLVFGRITEPIFFSITLSLGYPYESSCWRAWCASWF